MGLTGFEPATSPFGGVCMLVPLGTALLGSNLVF